MSFLESFTHNKFHADRNGINPDVIFSANRHFSDDVFKIWAASKVDSGCKLVVGQHGGGPFINLMVLCNLNEKLLIFMSPWAMEIGGSIIFVMSASLGAFGLWKVESCWNCSNCYCHVSQIYIRLTIFRISRRCWVI